MATQSKRSKVDVAIVVAGLIAAPWSGVAAYRMVGPYGDGPINVGLYRGLDPETGRQLLYRDVETADGRRLRYFFDEATRALREVRLVRQDGAEGPRLRLGKESGEISAGGLSIGWDAKGLVKTGFSLRGDGIIDAWEFRDANRQLQRIEVSRHQNGKVDRWEYYKDDQLTRVEEDDNRDGRVDRWLTYEAGILVNERRDRDGDGRADAAR